MTPIRTECNGFTRPLISERMIDEPRPLKVIYIGAGVSGIIGAIQFRKLVPTINLVIYEKNADIGGTWYENRYPGCACDVPSHSYQLSFQSSTDWSQFYACAPEILAYWKRVASKHDVQKLVRFQHKCIEARWDGSQSKWSVKLLKSDGLNGSELIEDTADVLVTGTGVLNEWKWPGIKGLHEFKGDLLHSADWDEAFDPKDKKVAVIGAGSSGIQIVPALADKVRSMDHYIRGKTWISSQLGEEIMQERTSDQTSTNFEYTAEEKAAWKRDPAAYVQYRKSLELGLQGNYAISQRDYPEKAFVRASLEQKMRDRLKGKPELVQQLIPDFPPFCKRLTPGPGYLEALASPTVNVILTEISHVDATGIWTNDGTHRPVDAIVCATGFETSPSAGFPIYGRDGINLRTKHDAATTQQQPRTYLGLCTDGFPNFFQSLGPNSFQGAGNLLVTIEAAHRYVARVLRRLAAGNARTVEPKRAAVELFARFCERYFEERTVYAADCPSWYKTTPTPPSPPPQPGAASSSSSVEEERRRRGRGRVTALWPGSSVHMLHALEDVRWEDFEVESYDGNDFGWFGNGWTVADRDRSMEGLTWYLSDGGFLHEEVNQTV